MIEYIEVNITLKRSISDYGRLYCLAANRRGFMEAPCEYSLLPPLDCSLYNKTGDLVLLLCSGSVYQLEVRNRGEVMNNLSHPQLLNLGQLKGRVQ